MHIFLEGLFVFALLGGFSRRVWHEFVKSKIGDRASPNGITIGSVGSVLIAILIFVPSFNGLSEAFESDCRLTISGFGCPTSKSRTETQPAAPPATAEDSVSAPPASVAVAETVNQKCSRALDRNTMEWSSNTTVSSVVADLSSHGTSADMCRNLLGLAPIVELNEPIQIESQTEAAPPPDAPEPTDEAAQPTQMEWPVGTIANDKGPMDNIRKFADKSSELLGTVENGTVVYLLGVKMSNSGFPWCRIATSSGLEGYVLDKTVDGDCELNRQQANALAYAEQKRMEQGLRAMAPFIVLLGRAIENGQ